MSVTDEVIAARKLLQEDPEEVVRRHPDRCLTLADRAREQGRHAIADRIEEIVEGVTDQ